VEVDRGETFPPPGAYLREAADAEARINAALVQVKLRLEQALLTFESVLMAELHNARCDEQVGALGGTIEDVVEQAEFYAGCAIRAIDDRAERLESGS
jgi:hypothetical protein